MKISKRQLKRIIREEYSRLKGKGLIRENVGGAPLGEFAIFSGGPDPVAFHISVVKPDADVQIVGSAQEAIQVVGDPDLVFWSGSHQSFQADPEDAWFVTTVVEAAADYDIVTDEYYDELMDRFMDKGYDYSAGGY